MSDHFINYINMKEPRSNRGLEQFFTPEEVELLKKGKIAEAALTSEKEKKKGGKDEQTNKDGESEEQPKKAEKKQPKAAKETTNEQEKQ